MVPKKIELVSPEQVSLLWDDGHESIISVQSLRDHCPCAGCRGETVLLKTYTPAAQPHLPGRYILEGIQQVGHYALQISWGDSHATGIYTWEHLRSLCECRLCVHEKKET